MPLSPFQRAVILLLAANRNPESHAGGGAVINRSDQSPRFSSDIDLFHDAAESVAVSAAADAAVLAANGYAVAWLLEQPYLRRARVGRGGDSLRLDWCYDSAFRFFPVQQDPEFGYCLHPADVATNKVLALAGRSEVRDFVDTIYLHKSYLSLGALCWAACGKDEGFTPWLLLDLAKRNVKFRDEDLAGEDARPAGDASGTQTGVAGGRDGGRGLVRPAPRGRRRLSVSRPRGEAVHPRSERPRLSQRASSLRIPSGGLAATS